MVTKKAFQHFKGIYELPCGWEVEDEYYKEVIEPEIDKMYWTCIRAEFMYKCLYDGEKPLSKRDYGRTRFTHDTIHDKMTTLFQVRTKSEIRAFNRGIRKMQIQKALYATKLQKVPFKELLEEYEELKNYYERGVYKRGGYIDKFVQCIHRF